MSSFRTGRESGRCRSTSAGKMTTSATFGLYMYEAWQPTWPDEVIPWPDFSAPDDWEKAATQIEAAFARARAGETVEIGCRGGLGRTGTVLAYMAILAGVTAADAVAWVRKNYQAGAVETNEQ